MCTASGHRNQSWSSGQKKKNLYHVASYRLENTELEIKILNTEVVDDDLKTTEALTQSFLKHEGNKKLFINPGRFRRIENKANQSRKKQDTPSCFFMLTGEVSSALGQALEQISRASRSIGGTRRTCRSSRAAPGTPPDDTERRRPAWSCASTPRPSGR